MSMLAFLVLGIAMLGTFCGLDLVWLHPTPVWLCLDITTCKRHLYDAGLLYAYPFFAPCDDMLVMLACATHWLSLAFMHIYTLTSCSCMSLAYSYVVHAPIQWNYGHSI